MSGGLNIIDVGSYRADSVGCVEGMLNDEYRSSHGLSQSSLNQFAECPRAYAAGVKKTATAAMQNGSLLHRSILEGIIDAYVRPDTYESEGKVKPWSGNSNTCKEWLQTHADKPVIDEYRRKQISSLIQYVHGHPLAGGLLSGGFAELSCFADCIKTGRRIKGRMDYVKIEPDWVSVIDLKTTNDASTNEFSKTIYYRRYHVQAAFYKRILSSLGVKYVRYYLLALEEGDLPRLNVRELNPLAIHEGEKVLDEDLARLKECESTNIWPEWPDYEGVGGIPLIDLPEYAYSDEIQIT